ncbi:MAG: M36 family metallopeptidase [Myxococcales bacterium]|nr:M36 family metallopeptidase [Myxococcales bacterium]
MRASGLLFASLLTAGACTSVDVPDDRPGAPPVHSYRQVAELDLAARGPVDVVWDEALDRPRQVVGEFAVTGPTEAAARGFLRAHAALFQLARDGRDLTLATTRQGLAGTYLRFQQVVGDLPVFDHQVVVALSAAGDRVRAVTLGHAPVTLPPPGADVGAAAALATARAAVGAPVEVAAPTTLAGVTVDGPAPRRAYRVTLVTARATWDVGVDAGTGAVLWQRDRTVTVNGTGLVFDANAVSSTGMTALTDNNDATSAALDAARVTVTLPNLDGSGVLRGTYADARPTNINQRAQSATHVFNYDRADNRFEEVVTYYHLDRAQARIQALGFTMVNNRVQIAVVNDGNQDNSFYSPGTRQLSFGAGGVDDAEDGDIVLHEYGHSIQDNQVPGWGGGNQSAMGEGFGDYLAGSFMATLAPAAGHPQLADPACVGDWDAVSYDNRTPKCLRRLDEPKHYPEAATGEVHDDGEMWSAALWRARTAVGADVADRIVIEAHELLGTSATFDQAASAVLAADQMVFAGAHVPMVRRALYRHGVLRTPLTGPGFPTVTMMQTVDVGNPVTGGQYANNLDDTQTVTLAGATAVRVHFVSVDTELDTGCLAGACDNIYLSDAAGDLYQIVSGVQTNLTSVQIPGDTVVVRLVTDGSVTRAGYRIDRIEALGGMQAIDAAQPIDAAPAIDAPQPIDAAQPVDAAQPIDAASGDDGGAGIDAGAGPDATDPGKGDESGGCCQTGAGTPPASTVLGLALVLGWLRRRRR